MHHTAHNIISCKVCLIMHCCIQNPHYTSSGKISWYTVGMPHSAHFRQTINTMEKMDELIRGVQEIFPDEV